MVFSALGLMMLIALIGACTGEASQISQLPEGFHPIDPLFESFYNDLGGKDTLGLGITPIFEARGSYYQYTVAALMVYNPSSTSGQRYYLAPLGLELGVNEKPVPPPEDDEAVFIEGHEIGPEFVSVFQELGGAEVAGRPLTEVHYNPDKNRHEQYFENVGFYLPVGGSQDQVRLLAYGAWKCSESCPQAKPVENAILTPAIRINAFTRFANQLGADFTGFALSEPYLSSKGTLAQIYENVVMVTDLDDPDQAILHPIAEELEIPSDPLEKASSDEDMHFYPLNGQEGFNVPGLLVEYIQERGGFEVFGPPRTRYNPLQEDVFRQCFENACLEVHRQDRGEFRVRPVPLGYTYREQFYPLPYTSGFQAPLDQISLQVWTSYPMVAPNQQQQVGVGVFSEREPLPGVEPFLVLTLPDGNQATYQLPPTGQDGHTGLLLEPIQAEYGTLIPYKVCVYTGDGNKFCVLDSYLIWETVYTNLTPTVPEGSEIPDTFFDKVQFYLPLITENLQSETLEIHQVFTYLPMLLR